MKKKNLLLILFFIIGGFINAQSYIIKAKPVGYKTWQYINIDGKVIIDRKDPVSYSFSEDGIAIVGYPRKNLYLLINTKGKVIDTEVTDFYLKDILGYNAQGFSDGLIVIIIDGKYGCLNTEGQLIVPAKYDNILKFNSGHGVGRIGKEFYIIDTNGKEIHVQEDVIDVKVFNNGLAHFVSKDRKIGFLNTNGEIVVPAKLRGAGKFSNELSWARNHEGLIGYINKKGEWIITPRYSAAKDFDNESGIARVRLEKEWMYVNEEGEKQAFNITTGLYDFSEGLAKGRQGKLFGFYNKDGEWAIEPIYKGVGNFNNGFAIARSNKLWGVINKNGDWVINPTYKKIQDVVKLK